jgi:hypothetical protein
MGRPRKKAVDLTTEEALQKLFPKKVLDEVKKEAKKTGEPNPSKKQG